jgi:hypothetical protein
MQLVPIAKLQCIFLNHLFYLIKLNRYATDSSKDT